MADPKQTEVSELESRKVAEASRQEQWESPSFIRELFLGSFRLDLIHPFPLPQEERPEFKEFFGKMEAFLKNEVDSAEIDRTGEYPEAVLDGLRRLGAFGMKVPKKYGGLGFNNVEYNKVMRLIGSCDGNLAALLSAHQSIGVPQPVKIFGTEEQKQRFLPRCAAGEITAFALTEPDVGSDPARVALTAEVTPDGKHYVLNGRKLWCTNGTFAKLLVVMAVKPGTRKISAFVVEGDAPGVTLEHRCRFMGLRAISNALLRFENVRVPVENLIGGEGKGLKLALTTLNDGRLSIPNICVGGAKAALTIVRGWCNERTQWGRPIGKHEAVSQRLADLAATTFAMESVADLATQMSDRGGYDIRLEAAAAQEWNTARGWELCDDTMQIRGGRGYENEGSLAGRGEPPWPVERMMRDFRINRIFEGSSEIMHLFMAREAVDKHLQVAGALIDPEKPLSAKLAVLPKMLAFYAWWYPSRWLGYSLWPRYAEFGRLATHLRFVERASRKLARESFHGMSIYQARLQGKQAFLFRLVDVVMELFAMAASATRAHALARSGQPGGQEAVELADLFCRNARRKVRASFKALWNNDDVPKYKVALNVLKGQHEWLEQGQVGLQAAALRAVRQPGPGVPLAAAKQRAQEPVGV